MSIVFRSIVLLSVFSFYFPNCNVRASFITMGPLGIHSTAVNFTGLNGNGIGIGQVEPNRPGLRFLEGTPFDDVAHSHSAVTPAGVFLQDGSALPNLNTDDHAEQVAGIMISSDLLEARGVAPGASLYSSAHATGADPLGTAYDETMLSIQHVSDQPAVRVVNHSWGKLLKPGNILDGNDLLSSGIDWSSNKHNVLHIVSSGNITTQYHAPRAHFNGLSVAASSQDNDGVYRQVAIVNYFPDLVGDRTVVDLIAPGVDVRSTMLNEQLSPEVPNTDLIDDGTSFAAPHATGTVALLQQYGDTQNWGASAQRHEVMKAVLMNSADKIKDTSGTGKYLGMDRTVRMQNVIDDWFDSPASYDYEIPLDEQMGTGHLNAKRALQQFKAGEHEFNGTNGVPIVGDVPVIGWDYGTTDGVNYRVNKYLLDQPLEAGNYISITLAWDREVELDVDADGDGEFDINDTFEQYTNLDEQLTNMDLWLVPKGTDDGFGDWESISESSVTSVEHIFEEIDYTGEYEIWVFQNQQFDAPQNYALAWWYGLAPELPLPGDFDGNGTVDGADLSQWQGDFGQNDDSDADGDGDSDGADFLAWQRSFGASTSTVAASQAVPEPAACSLLITGLLCITRRLTATRDRKSKRATFKANRPSPHYQLL